MSIRSDEAWFLRSTLVSANPDTMIEIKHSLIAMTAMIPGLGTRATANVIAKKVVPKIAYLFRESEAPPSTRPQVLVRRASRLRALSKKTTPKRTKAATGNHCTNSCSHNIGGYIGVTFRMLNCKRAR